MTGRETYSAIARKTGYTFMPPELQMCPSLYVCPTHVPEPEVPVENVEAYMLACRDYTERSMS